MSEPREFMVPEGCLFESTDESFDHYPDDPVTFMVSRYEYDLLKFEADKLAEAICKAMDETPIHEYCYDILEQALKEYRGE